MDNIDFYSDKKWCARCADYVPYLMSVEHSYCIECGAEVRLFSKDDWREFSADLAERKAKGAGKRGGKDFVVKSKKRPDGHGRESA